MNGSQGAQKPCLEDLPSTSHHASRRFLFLSPFSSHAAQRNACSAAEKSTRAKSPRPCLDLTARPGILRAHTLTDTSLPSKVPQSSLRLFRYALLLKQAETSEELKAGWL